MENGKIMPHRSSFSDPIGAILVVDDEPTYSYALIEILRGDGFDVAWTICADDARAAISDLSPDLLLVDVLMPGGSGLTLIRQLREQPAWADVPIIVISARTMSQDRAAALVAGADDFLPKPFSRQELRAAIRQFFPYAIPLPSIPAVIPSAV